LVNKEITRYQKEFAKVFLPFICIIFHMSEAQTSVSNDRVVSDYNELESIPKEAVVACCKKLLKALVMSV
jgi:hypothetical protein